MSESLPQTMQELRGSKQVLYFIAAKGIKRSQQRPAQPQRTVVVRPPWNNQRSQRRAVHQ